MALRRGFPAGAERIALQVRSAELGLAPDERFVPRALADLYGVPVVPLDDLVAAGAKRQSIQQLTTIDPGAFSAGTIFRGPARLIIYNAEHAVGRLANSLSHELSHLILEHEPTRALDDAGCRVWDPDMEDEANTLAGMLLVTREAALACARIGLPLPIGAARFGVSVEVMRMRTGKSGAAAQAKHGAARSGRVPPSMPKALVDQLPAAEDLAWVANLSPERWREVLKACRPAIVAKSVDRLMAVLGTFGDARPGRGRATAP